MHYTYGCLGYDILCKLGLYLYNYKGYNIYIIIYNLCKIICVHIGYIALNFKKLFDIYLGDMKNSLLLKAKVII